MSEREGERDFVKKLGFGSQSFETIRNSLVIKIKNEITVSHLKQSQEITLSQLKTLYLFHDLILCLEGVVFYSEASDLSRHNRRLRGCKNSNGVQLARAIFHLAC